MSGEAIRPSGWGRYCDDRRFTVLRRRDADGGDGGLLGRDEGLCALHLPKRTWVVKFDGKPIGYFYIDKVWDGVHRCYPLCTCSNGDIVVPSDAFLGYSSATTRRSNQINCWTFSPLTEDSSVRSILTGADYQIFLRQQLEQRQECGEITSSDVDRYMDEFAQYISEPGAGDSTSRTVNVDFASGTTVMIDEGGNGSWLENGSRSLYGIFAPGFFEFYKIYPFDETRRNTWVWLDGRHFCVGYREHRYYASALSPQGYETVSTFSGAFDGEDGRPVVFLPVSSEFATYETEIVRGSYGWELRYTNLPAGSGVLNIVFGVPVAGTYTSGIGLMQNGQFFYNDYFDVRELNEHGGPFTRTDYVRVRCDVEYDVETLEVENIEALSRDDVENVTQDWSSSGGRYLGTESTTTTYPEDLESHITFERL